MAKGRSMDRGDVALGILNYEPSTRWVVENLS